MNLFKALLTAAEIYIWTFLAKETNLLHGEAELLPVVELIASARWQGLGSGLKKDKINIVK